MSCSGKNTRSRPSMSSLNETTLVQWWRFYCRKRYPDPSDTKLLAVFLQRTAQIENSTFSESFPTFEDQTQRKVALFTKTSVTCICWIKSSILLDIAGNSNNSGDAKCIRGSSKCLAQWHSGNLPVEMFKCSERLLLMKCWISGK